MYGISFEMACGSGKSEENTVWRVAWSMRTVSKVCLDAMQSSTIPGEVEHDSSQSRELRPRQFAFNTKWGIPWGLQITAEPQSGSLHSTFFSETARLSGRRLPLPIRATIPCYSNKILVSIFVHRVKGNRGVKRTSTKNSVKIQILTPSRRQAKQE